MKIGVPRETDPETRIPLIPTDIKRLVQLGAEVAAESGMGMTAGYSDADLQGAGARIVSDRAELLGQSDLILRLRRPPTEEVSRLKKGCVHISFLDPFREKELIQSMAEQGVSAISMELMPRITRAQKMDALSSQANLAGYVAVILAATHVPKVFPLMMTAAGTVQPVRVFVVGAGVAGLQAIATAKRLGARVEAFDTRPVVAEQVESLGAKFVKIDVGETGQTDQGYAKALTEEQLEKQRQGLKKICSQADVVITTAQVFGKKAPIIVTNDMVQAMKPGSVIVDLAVEGGGNVESTVRDQVTDKNGVKIVGLTNLPGRVPVHASQLYSANLSYLVETFWNQEKKQLELNLDDEILQRSLVTHQGKVR